MFTIRLSSEDLIVNIVYHQNMSKNKQIHPEMAAMWKCLEHFYDCINIMNQMVNSVERTASICSSLREVSEIFKKFNPSESKGVCEDCEYIARCFTLECRKWREAQDFGPQPPDVS